MKKVIIYYIVLIQYSSIKVHLLLYKTIIKFFLFFSLFVSFHFQMNKIFILGHYTSSAF